IMWRHMLPNAMVASLTFLPFVTSGAVTTLTSLDFLGFGMPPGSPSLGELLNQGKNNLQAPWLGFTAFGVIALMLSLLVFIGEALRDAFDPRKIFAVKEGVDEVEEAAVEAPSVAPLVAMTSDALLEVQNLRVRFGRGRDAVEAVKGISFSIRPGET